MNALERFRRTVEKTDEVVLREIDDAGYNNYRTKVITAIYLLSEFVKISDYEGVQYSGQPVKYGSASQMMSQKQKHTRHKYRNRQVTKAPKACSSTL